MLNLWIPWLHPLRLVPGRDIGIWKAAPQTLFWSSQIYLLSSDYKSVSIVSINLSRRLDDTAVHLLKYSSRDLHKVLVVSPWFGLSHKQIWDADLQSEDSKCICELQKSVCELSKVHTAIGIHQVSPKLDFHLGWGGGGQTMVCPLVEISAGVL